MCESGRRVERRRGAAARARKALLSPSVGGPRGQDVRRLTPDSASASAARANDPSFDWLRATGSSCGSSHPTLRAPAEGLDQISSLYA